MKDDENKVFGWIRDVAIIILILVCMGIIGHLDEEDEKAFNYQESNVG